MFATRRAERVAASIPQAKLSVEELAKWMRPSGFMTSGQNLPHSPSPKDSRSQKGAQRSLAQDLAWMCSALS